MRRHWTLPPGLALGLTLLLSPAGVTAQDTQTVRTGAITDLAPLSTSTADHSAFEILQKEFASGPEVTAACLSCHTEADDQVMHSIHYTWDYTHEDTGQELGKSNVINAFCGNVAGNEARCTSCHAGYGWTDMSVTPAEAEVTPDCLICHDTTGTYNRTATGAGHPTLDPVPEGARTITGALAVAVDLSEVAQHVGMPGRENCGSCHFYGGGGDNVKHGDLSSALYDPAPEVDVHMSADGANFTCSTCHVEESHSWAGSRYDTTARDDEGIPAHAMPRDSASCQSCHDNDPHPMTVVGLKLNDHTDTVACQTCHIPTFARGGVATKTWWDWSTAGRLNDDGTPVREDDFIQSDGSHLHTYMSEKGNFDYGENVVPTYAWFNGTVTYTMADEVIDPSGTVPINTIWGDPEDGESLIWPFKVMRGRQAYDAGNNTLVYTHVWGPTTDTAFWTNFDWNVAIEAGMQAAGADYSGDYGFVDTEMSWPITHMVAPAEDAVQCAECHTPGGRMAAIPGVFMPGTAPGGLVGLLGQLMLLGTIAGIAVHAGIRMIGGRKGSHDG